jgi:acyl-CoA synthetase (AMP-forming)/AMP-acid ligase II/thioesterase domain-containing protein
VNSRTLQEIVARGAALTPGEPALVATDRSIITYAALHEHVIETGEALRSAGIRRADTVAMIFADGPSAAATFLAIGAAAVCAPLNPAYKARELEFYLDDLGARLVVVPTTLQTEARHVASLRGIAVAEILSEAGRPLGRLFVEPSDRAATQTEPAGEDDGALVLHTSGTTARPKIVPLTHGRLTASASTIATTLGLDASDRCLNVMPLFHIHGLVAGLLAPLDSGGSVICPPGFNAANFLGWVENLEPTWYTAVPTMHQAILTRLRNRNPPVARHRLRFARSSSAPLPVPVLEGLERQLGVPVIEAYGMTEAAHQIASNPLPPARRIPGTVGKAAGPEISIVDEDGEEIEVGSVGEVAIRGESVFGGYAENPEANASAFVRGWFRTGDLGSLDEHGYLQLRGRIKEIINRGGEKIAPAEIDEVLLLHPAVAQSVTFAIPDARLGEEVAAAVVLSDGLTADERELQDYIVQTLAPFKVPRRIVIVEEIPKGPTGKVQRIGMHKRLGVTGSQPDGGGHVRPRSHLESVLVGIWSDVLGIAEVGVSDDFFALGGDSILGAEAVGRIREMIGRPELPLISIVRAPTPAGMVEEIMAGGDTDDVLVALRADGAGLPLFLTHGGDLIVSLPALASRLKGGRPIYGLQPRPVDPLSGQLTIEGIAAEFVAAMRLARPEGPYLLAGICSGGPIMLEVARLIVADGDGVDLLVLIDPRLRAQRGIRHYAKRAVVHGRRGSLSSATARKMRSALTNTNPPVEVNVPAFNRQLSAARDAYNVSSLAGVRAALILSADYSEALEVPAKAWRGALPDGFALQSIPFSHTALLFPPAIDALAAMLDDVVGVPEQ